MTRMNDTADFEPITAQNSVSDFEPIHSPSLLQRASTIAGQVATLPYRAALGAVGDIRETATDPKKAIKDLYQGARAEAQNNLLPALQTVTKTMQSLPVNPLNPLALLERHQQPIDFGAYTPDDPESNMTKTGSFLAQAIPGGKAADLTEFAVREGAKYLPEFLGKKLATGLAAKTASGVTTAPIFGQDPVNNILANLAFHGAAGAGKVAGNFAKNIASKALIPEAVTGSLKDSYDTAAELSNQDTGNIAKTEYEKLAGSYDKNSQEYIPGIESKLWDQSKSNASNIDAQNPNIFDTTYYRRKLLDAKNDLNEDYGRYPDAKSAIDEVMGNAINKTVGKTDIYGTKKDINSLSDAINERQLNNQDYAKVKTLTKDPQVSDIARREAHNKIRDALVDSMQNTISKNIDIPGMSQFADDYANANAITQYIKNTFESKVPASGKGTVPTKFINNYHNLHPDADISNFHDEFVPKSKEEGMGKILRLQRMLGDNKEETQNLLKRHIFKNAIDGDQINPTKMWNAYNKLSENHKNYIFSEPEKQMFNILQDTRKIKPSALRAAGKYTMLPLGLVSVLHDGLHGLQGNDLGNAVGQRMLMSEINKRMGREPQAGIAASMASALARGAFLSPPQQTQGGQ
ncbi:MAG: hypothetical protein JSW00_04090 [Thermoplasmata archaeon]|nr:MAG: hypothetical protein JSW00_04090 [Thermoplasmata archaeon]